LSLMEEVDALRAERQQLHHLFRWMYKVVQELTAVCAELTNDAAHRRWLHESHRRAAREAAKLQLPYKFWQPETTDPDPETLRKMLAWRVDRLRHEFNIQAEDAASILSDFVAEYLCREPDPKLIAGLTLAAYRRGRH